MDNINENPELQKALKRVKVADKVRLIFMFTALLIVLFIFCGNKFATEAVWYQENRACLYELLFVAIIVMLGAGLTKMILAARYNRILQKK